MKKVSEEKKKVRSRVFEIVQYEKNRVTGEDLGFNERTILDGLAKRERGLQNWAYIRHDKDVYVEGDDIPEGQEVGDVRPPHWHVILQFNSQAELDSVAKAFGVAEQFVEKKTGTGAFFDCLYYLVHEDDKQREKGKHVYERSEVYMIPSVAEMNWETVDAREERRMKRLPQALEVEAYIKKLSAGKITLNQVFKESPVLYSKNQSVLKIARRTFLANAEPPLARVNYYMQGPSGTGKTTAAKALARVLFPGVPDNELFCVVSQDTMFEHYDGQPVLIWDDWRASNLLERFDRGMIWKIFAVNPLPTVVNVKYSSVNLINSVNIMTSVGEFHEFMNELAGEYTDKSRRKHKAEDKNQGYRRFPVFLEIAQTSYDLYVSNSLGGGEYQDYQRVARVEANLLELAKNSSPENDQKVIEPVAKLHNQLYEKSSANEEIQEVKVKVIYDDISKPLPYVPIQNRKPVEDNHEYFYFEECTNCHNQMNRITKNKEEEGALIFVPQCNKCDGLPF